MTLLELYEKLCTGEIKLDEGLCDAISSNIDKSLSEEFSELMCNSKTACKWFTVYNWRYGLYLENKGTMTPERETFLLLFAAYKGEL